MCAGLRAGPIPRASATAERSAREPPGARRRGEVPWAARTPRGSGSRSAAALVLVRLSEPHELGDVRGARGGPGRGPGRGCPGGGEPGVGGEGVAAAAEIPRRRCCERNWSANAPPGRRRRRGAPPSPGACPCGRRGPRPRTGPSGSTTPRARRARAPPPPAPTRSRSADMVADGRDRGGATRHRRPGSRAVLLRRDAERGGATPETRGRREREARGGRESEPWDRRTPTRSLRVAPRDRRGLRRPPEVLQRRARREKYSSRRRDSSISTGQDRRLSPPDRSHDAIGTSRGAPRARRARLLAMGAGRSRPLDTDPRCATGAGVVAVRRRVRGHPARRGAAVHPPRPAPGPRLGRVLLLSLGVSPRGRARVALPGAPGPVSRPAVALGGDRGPPGDLGKARDAPRGRPRGRRGRWCGGSTVAVQVGDQLDRGATRSPYCTCSSACEKKRATRAAS